MTLFHTLISNGICSLPNPARRKSRSAAASARKSTGKRASSRRATGSLGGTPAAKRSERFTEGIKMISLFLISPNSTPFSPLQAAASWGTPGAAAELLSEDESDDEEIEEQWLGRVGSTGETVAVTCPACSEFTLSFVQALTSYNLCNCQPSARAAVRAWRQPPNAAQSSAMTRKKKTRLRRMMCRKRQKRCDLVMVVVLFHGRLAMSASGVAYNSTSLSAAESNAP